MSVHVHEVLVRSQGRVLAEVADVRLEPGRATTIVGESGSGKSLFAHAVMGTLPPELAVTGRAAFDGAAHDLADAARRRRLWGRELALLPQEPVLALDPTMRVGSQVAEGARVVLRDRRTARGRARDALAAVGLAREERAFPHTLSGGMAQRVAFAAATAGGARVLLADEPSKGLDELARADLLALLRRHVERGGALLTITHDLDLARGLGGEVLVMRDAAVVERGEASSVLERPEHPWTRRLLAAEPARWAPADRSADGRSAGEGRVLVAASGLTAAHGDEVLFTDLALQVRAGERVALTGPSGSGKTTLGDVLLRLRRPDAGGVHHDPVLGGGRAQKLYQDPALAFPPRVALRHALGDVVRRHRVDPARVEQLLAALRLSAALLERRPGQVSGGELQRLAVVRAVLPDPALVVADEPTSRLDLITQEETVRCLLEQLDRHDCALVLITHDDALATTVTQRRVRLPQAQQAVAVR
ncbi:ABC transporter ATP-binding protein [Quadrisphaera sp. DSM 44207]|uniref:ABC transporter ATP-binding protein n=1 Tax=Quadrisphaera sp. DSM 44207 TaxID=1881057 RepID=UPI000891A98F|nr:ATP-binding cassette domain-containing protein [Quadrisphaera sp. DSM 44207]SDQ51545.1 peptide/nickel transport system ATP-binding protein [Quadrisphaera sp. DSM 44207]